MGAKIQKIYLNIYLSLEGLRTKIIKTQPFLHKEAEGVIHVHLIANCLVFIENKISELAN